MKKLRRKNPYISNLDNTVKWIGVHLFSFFKNGKVDKEKAIAECKDYFKNRGLGMPNFTLTHEYFWRYRNIFIDHILSFYSHKFEQIFNSSKPYRTKLGEWKTLILDKELLAELEMNIMRHVEYTEGTQDGHSLRERGVMRDYIGQTINKLRKNPVPISIENFRRWMQIYLMKNLDLTLSDVAKGKIYIDISKYFKIDARNYLFTIPNEWTVPEGSKIVRKTTDGIHPPMIYPKMLFMEYEEPIVPFLYNREDFISMDYLTHKFLSFFFKIKSLPVIQHKKMLYWKFFTSSYKNLFWIAKRTHVDSKTFIDDMNIKFA